MGTLKTKPATSWRNAPPPSRRPLVARRFRKDSMHLLKVGRFHINLDYIQFIHEEREDLILHFGEGTNLRTTSVARNSPAGELLQRFMVHHLWADPSPA